MKNITFMGTTPFAVKCLESLIRENIDIRLVITQPDRPMGRKRRLAKTPVREWAQTQGIEVWQPANVNESSVVDNLKAIAPDLIVVVAYGQILRASLLDLPPLGCINVHASLLPALRGAAPIQWALLRGFEETGVTTMFMDTGLDTGDIILQAKTAIDPEDNRDILEGRLAGLAGELLPKTVAMIRSGTAPRTKQPQGNHDYAPALKSCMERIDWDLKAVDINNLIRALAPRPGAYCLFRDKRLKILAGSVQGGAGTPGIITIEGGRVYVGTGSGVLELTSLQPEGKAVVTASDFINGYRVQEGDKLL